MSKHDLIWGISSATAIPVVPKFLGLLHSHGLTWSEVAAVQVLVSFTKTGGDELLILDEAGIAKILHMDHRQLRRTLQALVDKGAIRIYPGDRVLPKCYSLAPLRALIPRLIEEQERQRRTVATNKTVAHLRKFLEVDGISDRWTDLQLLDEIARAPEPDDVVEISCWIRHLSGDRSTAYVDCYGRTLSDNRADHGSISGKRSTDPPRLTPLPAGISS